MALSFDRKKKIAITGTVNCGKTVFLTSLLWQLEEHEDARFFLPRISLSGFRERRRKDRSREERFPYDRYRDALAERGQWPRKTRDFHRYHCEIDRSDWRWWTQSLEFLDFPGERIADAAMMVYDDHGDWSDRMFDHFESNSGYSEVGQRFRQDLEVNEISADAAVKAYRLALARFIRDYKPLVSPSVFLLDRTGVVARNDHEETLAAVRRCGLDEESQFAPLPKSVREANPKLAKTMQRHYRQYRKDMVLPLFTDLMTAQSLVVLVDIPSLLVGGVGRYNDNRQIVLDLIEAMRSDSVGGRILKRLRLQSSLDRIAFVATKADLVSRNDIENGRLESLLKQMNARGKKLLSPTIDVKWFICSACLSTTAGKTAHTLTGIPMVDNADRQEMEFPVSPLPESWPDDWSPMEYCFPDVLPRARRNVQIPPDHMRLDTVFDFIPMR